MIVYSLTKNVIFDLVITPLIHKHLKKWKI